MSAGKTRIEIELLPHVIARLRRAADIRGVALNEFLADAAALVSDETLGSQFTPADPLDRRSVTSHLLTIKP